MPETKKATSAAKLKSKSNQAGRTPATGKSRTPAKSKAARPRKPQPKRKAPAPIVSSGYWLLKSEPDAFSWDELKAKGKGGEEWSGVRNYLARNNMRAMQLGDLAFFYHSNIGLEIVGICEICASAHPDSTADDPKWECVDVRAVRDMPRTVSLKDVKANPKLANMSLVTSMRLSVQPVTKEEWDEICHRGGLDAVPRPRRR